MRRVRQRKRDMVDGLIAMHLDQYRASGAELIMGAARFLGPKTVEVRLNDGGRRTLAGERVFLNLGTHAAIPPIPGLADARPLTNIELLELDRLPEHLVVLGGGYVGLEFAQAYRRFGSRVTVIDNGEHLLSREDPDVAAELRRILAGDGIDILLAADVLHVEGRSGEGVRLRVRTAGREQTIAASDVLVATGRTPNTAGIGLEIANVELDPRGYIRVNDRLETTAPGVWAIGECAGSPQFTHVNCGLPAHSPIAQTSGALVSSRSLTLMYPRGSSSTSAISSPMPAVLGVRPVATRTSLAAMVCSLPAVRTRRRTPSPECPSMWSTSAASRMSIPSPARIRRSSAATSGSSRLRRCSPFWMTVTRLPKRR